MLPNKNMKLFTLRLCMGVVCAFVLAEAKSQKIDSMMNLYANNFPQEKVHVHFDKSYYNPGETIWFKGYVLTGANLSEVSRNFYAELIDEKGKVLQRSISPMVNSSAAGSFTVPSG